MDNFDKLTQKHRQSLDNLYRAYKLNGRTDIEKIKAGFDLYGENFVMKVLSIITPKDHVSHFEATLEAKLPTPEIVGLQTPVYTTTGAPASTTATPTATTGKGWAFWEKFLTAAGNTGKTIGGIISDVSNTTANQTAEQQAQAMQLQQAEASNTRTLYVIAGVFLAVILLIFAFKK